MTGYDLDGTLTLIQWRRLGKLLRWLGLERACVWLQRNAPCRTRPTSGVIVTGRTARVADLTHAWLTKNGIDLPVFFSPYGRMPTREEVDAHKADVIRRLAISEFHEDTEDGAQRIRVAVPECNVVLVR